MKISPLLYALPLSLFLFTSCGSDSDDDDDSSARSTPPIEEEEERNCLTENQNRDVRVFLTRLATLASIDGAATQTERLPEGDFLRFTGAGTLDIVQNNANSWSANGRFCGIAECLDVDWTGEFRNGCFYADDELVTFRSTSSTRLNFTSRSPDGTRTDDVFTLTGSGDFRAREGVFEDNQRVGTFEFE